MPLTPFHLGPGLFFGMILVKYLDLVAFLLGSVILDIEPALVVLYNLKYPYRSYPHHAFFHTILGALLVSLLAAIILNKSKEKIKKRLQKFDIVRISSFRKIFLSVLSGTLLHLLFDSFMHYDVFPFWPSHFNPLLGLVSFSANYSLCIISGIFGVAFLIFKLKKRTD